jgi:hypothetical protein
MTAGYVTISIPASVVTTQARQEFRSAVLRRIDQQEKFDRLVMDASTCMQFDTLGILAMLLTISRLAKDAGIQFELYAPPDHPVERVVCLIGFQRRLNLRVDVAD